jgi:hypothetical protein
MFIVFDKNNFDISRIGSNAFSEIPNLMSLSFHDIPIGNISANAFDFKNNSTQTLDINLINCGLSETSLEEGVFSDAKRPLNLDLSMNFKLFINSEILKNFIFKIGENNIILIEESKFGQFFINDIQNTIILSGNLLDCDNLESFLWLLNQKSDLELRVQYAKCANGSDFWDLNPNGTITPTTTGTPVGGMVCQIDGNNLNCDANYESFNITAEIEYLSQTLPENEKNFENLVIQRSSIEEIPENAFQDISFNIVQIHDANNLKRVHTKAFNNKTVSNLRKQFYVSVPNQLRNDPPDYDFWKAFSSLTYIKVLYLSLGNGSHEIPENAFEPINESQNDLNYMVFESNNFEISRIGSNAFSEIPNLLALSFEDIPIHYISAKAFDFRSNSTQNLEINFINCGLSETSLEEGIFSDAKRPLILDLSMN